MSNTKIIKTACRQRDDAQRRAADYKKQLHVCRMYEEAAQQRATEATRYGNRMLYKFIKERRKFLLACFLLGGAIAVAVFK